MPPMRNYLFAILSLLISHASLSKSVQEINADIVSIKGDSNTSLFDSPKNYLPYIKSVFKEGLPKEPKSFFVILEQNLKYAQSLKDKAAEAEAHYYIAKFYIAGPTGYSDALPEILKALTIFEELNDTKGKSKCYMQLGLIGYMTHYYEDAIKNFKLSLDLNEYATSRYLMAISYAEIDSFSQAKKHFNRALLSFKQAHKTKNIQECYMYLGLMYIKEGLMDSAFYYLSKTLKKSGKDFNKYHARPLAILSEYYLAAENLDSAEYCALKSLELSSEQNEYLSPLISTKSLSTVYYRKKDFEKAHNYLRAHVSLQSIDFQDGARQKITEMQTIFEFKKKIREEEIRHEEEIRKKNRTRNLMLIASVFVLLLAGGLWSRLNYVRRTKSELQKEKNISENLLLNILPAKIALELKTKGKAEAQNFELASILFTDFKDFTEFSAKLSASDLVKEINLCFEAFDGIIEKYGIEKIKTIGDSYMAAGGLPIPSGNSVKNTLLAAIELQEFIEKRKMKLQALGQAAFEMRVGIHTGPVVAGIVGIKKFQYDIWGDTVNTASRMESCGAVGKVNISEATFQLLKNDSCFKFEARGKVAVKGKGEMAMYFAYKAELTTT